MSSRTWEWVKEDPIQAGALAFALVATAHAEYTLATATHVNGYVAVAVPGALDLYVIRALQQRRDVFVAVLAMVAANVTSHLIVANVLPVRWQVISAVGAVAPLVVWRVYSLKRTRTRNELLMGTPAGTDPMAPGVVSTPVPALGTGPGTRTWKFWRRTPRVPETGTERVENVPETVPVQVSAYSSVPVWAPGYHLDGCDGVHEGDDPEYCVGRTSAMRVRTPDHVPADWAIPYLVPVPDLPAEYDPDTETGTPGTVVHSAVLAPGDAEYVPAAREYVRSTKRPSVAGMKAAASVGQARAVRLLAYLETEEE